MYNPVKFSVYRNAALNSSNVDTVITFDTKLFDTGSNVDIVTNKGRFTAPVAGFYYFNAVAGNTAATATLMRTGIMVNSVLKKIGSQATPGAANNLFEVSGLIQLAANDYVEATFVGGNGSVMQIGANQCYFDGFLVSTT
jgi:hypothetical protein